MCQCGRIFYEGLGFRDWVSRPRSLSPWISGIELWFFLSSPSQVPCTAGAQSHDRHTKTGFVLGVPLPDPRGGGGSACLRTPNGICHDASFPSSLPSFVSVYRDYETSALSAQKVFFVRLCSENQRTLLDFASQSAARSVRIDFLNPLSVCPPSSLFLFSFFVPFFPTLLVVLHSHPSLLLFLFSVFRHFAYLNEHFTCTFLSNS